MPGPTPRAHTRLDRAILGAAVVLLVVAVGAVGAALVLWSDDDGTATAPSGGTTDAPGSTGEVAPNPQKDEGHGHGPVEFVALDAPEQAVLDAEWDRARAAALRYPTLQDALDAGFEVAQFEPSTGAHVIRWDLMDDAFSIDEPEQLLYETDQPDAPVMALSYHVVTESTTPPAGFTSDNDHWHEHRELCLDRQDRTVLGMGISEAECDSRGGAIGTFDGWMLHVWILPGWENANGVYAADNPTLRARG